MSVTHRSISIADEGGTFGSLNASTGLPSPSGLTFTSLPAERDPVIIFGEAPVSERPDLRDGPYGYQPELDTVWSGSNRVQRRTGEVSVRIDFTTGTGAYTTTGLGLLLRAGLKRVAHTATSSDSVSAANGNQITPTDETDWAVGGLISSIINGRAEYSALTSNDRAGAGTDIGVSPSFSAAPSTIYPMDTFYLPTGTNSGTVDTSVCFRVDGVNFRTYAFGCKLSSLAISLEGGRVMGDFTFQAACIIDDHDDSFFSTGVALGPVEPVFLAGAPAHFRGSYVVLSSTAPTTSTDKAGNTGDELARTALDCESFEITLTNELTPKGHSNSILAMSDMEVSNATVEATLTLSAPASLVANDFRDRVSRQVLVGTGPTGTGKGAAFYIPSAFLTVDPLTYDVSGEIVKQVLTYNQGRFGGDVGTGDAKNSLFRIGLGV